MMRLDENLFEALDMTKDEYLRDAAKISWESGHSYDPDDFSYFKRVCKDDGYDMTEEDFQKYWEYFDECRANQFSDEHDNDVDLGDWEEMESKQVEDADGFMTDYTWYVKDNDDGSETHVMIFGDQDIYTPMNSEPDAEFDGEDVAREWFDNYKGFAEDLEEAIDSEDEIYNGYVVRKSDTSDNYFVYDNNGHVEDDEHKGQGYPTKEKAIERANSLKKGIAKSNSDLEETYHKDSFGQSNWYENVDDVMHDYEKGWLTKSRAIEICDEEGWEFYDDLEEAIKPDIESEELKALAQKHNIKILDAMSNGDLRMEGAGADLMKFYQEAEKLGLWQVNPELYEALHGISEVEEFTALAKKLGFDRPEHMKHIMNAAHSLGKSELEMLKSIDKTFNGKIPDTLIDGLTDEFLVIANEIGINDNASYNMFKKEEVEEGETLTQAIKRYKQELIDAGVDITKLHESAETLLNEIAVINVDKQAIFDAIANARAYIEENKFSQAKDSLQYASKLLSFPLEESGMSNLDLEIKQAGGEPNWKDKANAELLDMQDALHYLKTYAPKEVSAGGNFDSIDDLNDSIIELESAIDDIKTKLGYVNSIKRIGDK